jgi:response regulator RpfG family c-di-GMP phosphodiesterase
MSQERKLTSTESRVTDYLTEPRSIGQIMDHLGRSNPAVVLGAVTKLHREGLIQKVPSQGTDMYVRRTEMFEADKWREAKVVALHEIADDLAYIATEVIEHRTSTPIALLERVSAYAVDLREMGDELHDRPHPLPEQQAEIPFTFEQLMKKRISYGGQ